MVCLQEKAEIEKFDMDVKSEKVDDKVKSKQEENTKATVNLDTKTEAEKKASSKVDTKKKETPHSIDKEVLQACRVQIGHYIEIFLLLLLCN